MRRIKFEAIPRKIDARLQSLPVPQLFFNYDLFDYQDKHLFVRALDLLTAPITDDRLFTFAQKYSLSQQVNNFFSWTPFSLVMIDGMISELGLTQPDVRVSNRQYKLRFQQVYDPVQQITTLEFENYQLEPEFFDDVNAWLGSSQTTFVMHFGTLNVMLPDHGHVNVLVLRKTKNLQVVWAWIEQEGELRHAQGLQNKLVDLFPSVTFKKLDFNCPELQIGNSAGLEPNNCTQWQAMIILLLTKTGFFKRQQMVRLFSDLERSPNLNMLTFRLFFLFYVMSERPMFFQDLVYFDHNIDPSKYNNERFRGEVDVQVRATCAFYFEFSQCGEVKDLQDCNSVDGCRLCHGSCVHKSMIKTPPCDMMRVTDVVTELVNIQRHFQSKGLITFGPSLDASDLFKYLSPFWVLENIRDYKDIPWMLNTLDLYKQEGILVPDARYLVFPPELVSLLQSLSDSDALNLLQQCARVLYDSSFLDALERDVSAFDMNVALDLLRVINKVRAPMSVPI